MLSLIESATIRDAAAATHAGQPVRWKVAGLRVRVVIGGRERAVFSSLERRSFDALCREASVLYREEMARLKEPQTKGQAV
jgi:hypothetical protein